jgi:hypothetical protein
MTRIFMAGAAALALLVSGGAVNAAPVSKGATAFDGSGVDLSSARKKAKKKMMRRSGRTSTGTPRGRTDSPNVGSGTPKGQQQKGINRY